MVVVQISNLFHGRLGLCGSLVYRLSSRRIQTALNTIMQDLRALEREHFDPAVIFDDLRDVSSDYDDTVSWFLSENYDNEDCI